MPLYVYILAGLLAVSAGFGSGWKVRAWKAGNDVAAMQEQAAKDAAKRFEHATAAAAGYEVTRAKERERTVYVTREVEREVRIAGECARTELPSSLRDALVAAAADPDQPVAARAMPAAPAASAGDVGRRGD